MPSNGATTQSVAKGPRVRWYVMRIEVDLHAPPWRGNDVTINGMQMDVVSQQPAGMLTRCRVPR